MSLFYKNNSLTRNLQDYATDQKFNFANKPRKAINVCGIQPCQESTTTEHAKSPRNRYQTCQTLEIVGGGGSVRAYRCEADGDGEGARDDVSRVPPSSGGGGSPGLACVARLVALPPVGEGGGRENHTSLICSTGCAAVVRPHCRAAVNS